MTSALVGKTEKIAFDVTVIVVKKKKAVEMTDEWVKERDRKRCRRRTRCSTRRSMMSAARVKII